MPHKHDSTAIRKCQATSLVWHCSNLLCESPIAIEETIADIFVVRDAFNPKRCLDQSVLVRLENFDLLIECDDLGSPFFRIESIDINAAVSSAESCCLYWSRWIYASLFAGATLESVVLRIQKNKSVVTLLVKRDDASGSYDASEIATFEVS